MSEADKSFVISPKDFFSEVVREAFDQRKVSTFPMARDYLVGVLQFFIDSNNLFPQSSESEVARPQTLAEMFLMANSSESPSVRMDLLKRLGDSALYISGFFGDSLSKKIVDVDYYADMGGMAYSALASSSREDMVRSVYKEFSGRFLEFADVLTHISQKVLVQSDENLLRLYDRYLKTGSKVALEHLLEKGIVPNEDKKSFKQ